MIYKDKARAQEVAKQLGDRLGYGKAYAVRTVKGWTVITAWLPIKIGQYGALEIA